MTRFTKAISLAAAASLVSSIAPASADCAPMVAPPAYGPAPQWMPPVAQPPVYQPEFMVPPQPYFQAPPPAQFQAPPPMQYQVPPPAQFQAPPQPQFEMPPRPEFQVPPQPQFEMPPRPEFQAPPQPQFEMPPRAEPMPAPAPDYGYPAPYPYGGDGWDNDTNWTNDWFGDWGSLFDGTGHLEMDFELDMKMDWEAEADLDADTDTQFRGDSYYHGYDGYGPYAPYGAYGPGPWAPYTPAPVMPPVYPAPQPAAPAPAPEAVPAPVPPAPVSTDDDRDGVLNVGDFCPQTAEGTSVDAFGCAIDEAIVLRGVNFHTDSDKLTEESVAILDGVATTLLAYPELKLEVSGHTDSDGDDAYNKDLSQRRAEQVRNYLGGKGVKVDNLTARGYGEEKPIASNETAEGKAKNRRVELNRI